MDEGNPKRTEDAELNARTERGLIRKGSAGWLNRLLREMECSAEIWPSANIRLSNYSVWQFTGTCAKPSKSMWSRVEAA